MRASLWEEAGCDPGNEPHVVQLYRTPSFMQKAVASWLAPALERGGGAAVISTSGNASRVRAQLREDGVDVVPVERSGRLLIVDADDLMARFIVDDVPEADAFARVVSDLVDSVRDACGPDQEVRAWGEMVNLLWRRGNPRGAVRLEEMWNGVLAKERVRLLCSYGVADVDDDAYGLLRAAVGRTHGHCITENAPTARGLSASAVPPGGAGGVDAAPGGPAPSR